MNALVAAEAARQRPLVRGGGLVALLLGVLVSLPVIYVLSVGPLCWLLECGQISEDTFDVLIWPACVLADLSPTLEKGLDWYVDLWI